MPDVLQFAEEHGARRIVEGSFLGLGQEEGLAPTSDAKALYLQNVRRIERRRFLKTWTRFLAVAAKRGELPRGRDAELARWVVWKMIRFEATKSAQWIDFALSKQGFGGRRAEPTRDLPETFVQRARRLDKGGHTDAALDLLYDSIDELMRNKGLPQLDSTLANLRVSDLSVDMLLGILTATLPARSHLPSRATLFNEIEKALRGRGEYEEGLLTGLEG